MVASGEILLFEVTDTAVQRHVFADKFRTTLLLGEEEEQQQLGLLFATQHELVCTLGDGVLVLCRHSLARLARFDYAGRFWTDGRFVTVSLADDDVHCGLLLGAQLVPYELADAMLIRPSGVVQPRRVSRATAAVCLSKENGCSVEKITSRVLITRANVRLVLYFAVKVADAKVANQNKFMRLLLEQAHKHTRTKTSLLPRTTIGASATTNEIPDYMKQVDVHGGQIGALLLMRQQYVDGAWQSVPVEMQHVIQMLGSDTVAEWALWERDWIERRPKVSKK
eukprot:TRINITY_DN2577_c0_g1_i3.p1 TRINITY_DN2577_c0_g1~~TRINITY_DN2577_c0_g1_i3.p1  ORF type:complete len:281 (+),score=68.74 TRINITY_DN2577_c0_g1_i3:179-1021(+)